MPGNPTNLWSLWSLRDRGGGADQMARFISPLIAKYKLCPTPWIVINKSGGAGAEGFMYVKGKKKDPNMVIITLSNLFTTPLATGVPFSWKDMTPIARLALDYFVLWVNAEAPYKTAKEYLDAVKKEPGKFMMGGTGTAQEDQIITIMMEQAFGVKFTYVPFKGGGDVAVELVGKHINSSVNNPAEAVSHWKAGRLKPLATIDTRANCPSRMGQDSDHEGGHRGRYELFDASWHLCRSRASPKSSRISMWIV